MDVKLENTSVKDKNIVEIPYKQPYIEMFNDIKKRFDGQIVSYEQVRIFLISAYKFILHDLKDCEMEKCKKMKKVARFLRSDEKRDRHLLKRLNTKSKYRKKGHSLIKYLKRKKVKKIRRTLRILNRVSDELTAKVHKKSSIIKSDKKCFDFEAGPIFLKQVLQRSCELLRQKVR